MFDISIELSTKTIKPLYYYSGAVYVFLQHVKKYYLHLFPAFVSLMYQINKHFFYQCCDESKTTISKIDNNNFVVLLFDVDMSKLKEILSTPERAEVIKKNGISNEMFQFSSLG